MKKVIFFDLIKNNEIVEINKDRCSEVVNKWKEVFSFINTDLENYSKKDGDKIVYTILEVTEEELSDGDFSLHTEHVFEYIFK